MLGFEGYQVCSFESMDGYDVRQENTFNDERVKMHANPLPEDNDKAVTAQLKPLSFNVIRFQKK